MELKDVSNIFSWRHLVYVDGNKDIGTAKERGHKAVGPYTTRCFWISVCDTVSCC